MNPWYRERVNLSSARGYARSGGKAAEDPARLDGDAVPHPSPPPTGAVTRELPGIPGIDDVSGGVLMTGGIVAIPPVFMRGVGRGRRGATRSQELTAVLQSRALRAAGRLLFPLGRLH